MGKRGKRIQEPPVKIPRQTGIVTSPPSPDRISRRPFSPAFEPQTPNRKRIGLFGGAFNPIHLGHLRAGLEIREAFALDRIIFIPTALPPHKDPRELLPFRRRLEMVRLALADCPYFQASPFEGRQKGKSYSIRTIRHFKTVLGPKAELFFILGLDAFLEIHTWKDYQKLFSYCHFVVMDRPGFPGRGRSIRDYALRHLSPDLRYFPRERRFQHPDGFSLFLFPVTRLDISSTRIRSLRKQGLSVRFLLPEKVEQYILEKKLYAP
jgi:nicotinate-nucleotide adenylyltransferase